jgi:flagellar protein FliO/FliZ
MGTANNLRRCRRCLIAVLCAPLLAAAQTVHPPAYTPPPPSAISSGGILQIIFSLVLVLALVALVAWVLKRINLPRHGAGSLLRVISGVAVGQRERIVLVEVNNETWLVVGVAPGQVNALHTMPKGAMPAAPASAGFDADNKFQNWLKQVIEKRNAS